jgi:hypothetical protein
MKRILIYGGLLLTVFITAQCTRNSNNPVGADYFQRDNTGSEDFILLHAASSDTFYRASVTTGYSQSLYIGDYRGNKAMSFIYFSSFPDTGTVESASLTLQIRNRYGQTPLNFSPDAYVITEAWKDTSVTWEEANLPGFLGDRLDLRQLYSDDDSLQFALPAHLVQSWVDSSSRESNFGIALTMPEFDSGYLVELVSTDESLDDAHRPRLSYRMIQDTTEDGTNQYASMDAFAAFTSQEPRSDRLYIANGTALRSLLFFSVEPVPEEATINAAFMILYSDSLESFPDDSSDFEVVTFPITDGTWPIPRVPYNNSMGVSGVLTADSVVLNVTPFIQGWTADYTENLGFLLYGRYHRENMTGRSFYTSQADSALIPKLQLYYSLPPTSRL